MTKSKTSPKDGDYIDLDKSDFKKKKTFLKKAFFILFYSYFSSLLVLLHILLLKINISLLKT